MECPSTSAIHCTFLAIATRPGVPRVLVATLVVTVRLELCSIPSSLTPNSSSRLMILPRPKLGLTCSGSSRKALCLLANCCRTIISSGLARTSLAPRSRALKAECFHFDNSYMARLQTRRPFRGYPSPIVMHTCT